MLIRNPTSRSSGFTLVEQLVVLVLFALIAATIAPNLSGTNRRTQIDTLIAGLIDLDARARVLAGKHQVCYIQYDQEYQRLQLTVIDEESALVQEIVVPDFAALDIDQDMAAITYNRLGQTDDYLYIVETGEETIRMGFNGLSGWHEIQRRVGE